MKVVLSGKAGFCMGVKMAMDTVATLPFDPDVKIYTDGPIIHNPQVIEILKKRNIEPLEKDSGINGKTIIVRTHGITPERRKELIAGGANLIDVTCPRVLRIHKTIQREVEAGRNVVIYGDKNHSEVIALIGFTQGKGAAIESMDDIKKLPDYKKVSVVSQSTKNREDYYDFVEALGYRFEDIKVFDTLCDTTTKRQNEAVRLSKLVDVVVVVGGKSSANTRTLAGAIEKTGVPVFHIETEKEIDEKKFKDFNIVGLTAGASTPNWMINRVHEKLLSIRSKKESLVLHFLKSLARFFAYSNIFVSLAALCISFAAAMMLGTEPGLKQLLIGPLYVFSMVIFNIFVDNKSLEINQPSRINFLLKNQIILLSSAILATGITLYLAASLQLQTFLAILVAVLLGVIYSVPILPGKWSKIFHLHRLRDIPGSKNFFVAVAWAATTVLVHPLSTQGLRIQDKSAILVFIWVFIIVFNRTIVEEIRYLHGDAIIGHGTLPVLIGEKKVKRVLTVGYITAFIVLIAGAYSGILTTLGYILVLPLIYAIYFRKTNRRRMTKNNLKFEALLNLEFVLNGLLALAWSLIL